jgi:hypothetical protein
MKTLLVVAMVVLLGSFGLSQNAKPAKQRKATTELNSGDARRVPAARANAVQAPIARESPVVMPVKVQKWEYQVSDRGGFEPSDWQKKLNELAAEGWELDAIDEGHYIVRRRVELVGSGGNLSWLY